jgi:hypothetical protein
VITEHAKRLRTLYPARADLLYEIADLHTGSILPFLVTRALAHERLYPPTSAEMNEHPIDEEDPTTGSDPVPKLPLTGILLDEVEYTLSETLLGTGLAFAATRVEGGRGQWLAVHPQLAWVYKSVLTREVARQNSLQPTTDQIATQSADQDWTAEQIANALLTPLGGPEERRAHELSDRIGLLALQVALPSDLDTISTKKIVHIRQKYGAEFDAFGALVSTTVSELTDILAEVKDPKILDAYLRQEVERRFERPLEDLQKAMRGARVDTLLGALNVKFDLPTVAAATATSGGIAAGNPVLACAGAAFGLFGVVRGARQAQAEKLGASSASYLLHVGRLAPKSLLERVAKGSAGIARRELP